MTRWLFLLLAIAFCLAAPAQAANMHILGWVERVTLEPWSFTVKAKLDSGAKTSSLHAENIQLFERDDKQWVRFVLEVEDEDADKMRRLEVERPLLRHIRIKRHGVKNQRRAVVTMTVCINGRLHDGEFSLTDRDKFNYPVLLGRSFLKDFAVIDPGATFLSKPTCPEPAGGVSPNPKGTSE